MSDVKELGGNIRLSGFREVGLAEFVVVKKIVGSYARKFSDNIKGYESLSLDLKLVHKTESSVKYELHAKLVCSGNVEACEVTDRNLFVALDSALKKIEAIVK